MIVEQSVFVKTCVTYKLIIGVNKYITMPFVKALIKQTTKYKFLLLVKKVNFNYCQTQAIDQINLE